MVDVKATIAKGLEALRVKDLKRAEAIFQDVLRIQPGAANALHFMGAVRQLEGRTAEAERYFRDALAATPEDAGVHNSLGNLLNQMGEHEAALAAFEAALSHQPDLTTAMLNAAIVLQKLGRHDDALARLEALPTDAQVLTARGLSLKELGHLAKAEAAYRQALAVNPRYFRALHNLGGVLSLLGRAPEAVSVYEQALTIGPKVPELRYAYATALYDTGDVDGADLEFRTAIALKPDYIEAHDALNRLYWQNGKQALFGKSYSVCLKAVPMSAPMREAQVRALELAGRHTEALAAVEDALRIVGTSPALLHRQARLLASAGQMEEALASYNGAVKKSAAFAAAPIWLDKAKFLTRLARYDEALAALERAEDVMPHDQEMWAYRGLCWRLMGDSRAAWLNDYDTFIGADIIGVPDGYDSLGVFLKALGGVLAPLHTSKSQPLDQTLKGGTQSNGALLTRPDPVIRALRREIEKVVAAFIARLPAGPGHPFLSRKAAGFRFNGSWSVRLKPGGFHVNHVHPKGWISSSFYVAVPPSVSEGDADHKGWIKFGESGAGLAPELETVARRICPAPGLVVLFPSYMWHGTEPFADDAPRITAPFDIIPA
ncbi:tetratricopeptide repeat protein [Kordiimonas aestuarii]|uniref:tetratricopeptide repeat protein n=1 Tax=Kordiimonas aestuarii TaxID=1005925 RepID=UPI0021D34C07|nr:tetratricopeptide repeat protein [Kordiimonas aestuarii]